MRKVKLRMNEIDRLIIKYKENGKFAFIPDNHLKKPINTFDNSISEDIILLYKGKYQRGMKILMYHTTLFIKH